MGTVGTVATVGPLCVAWMAAVGEKASEAKSTSGCQNQKWVNTAMPTMPPICFCPDLRHTQWGALPCTA